MSTLQVASLGNDLIDLSDPDTVKLSENPKFLKRVFAPAELEFVHCLARELRDLEFWKIWAAKEAAYKALKRCDHEIIFSPSKFIFHENISEITFKNYVIVIKFILTPDYIHASAYFHAEDFQSPPVAEVGQMMKIQSELITLGEGLVPSYSLESSLCRTFAVKHLRKYFNSNDVEIIAQTGVRRVPQIFIDGKKTNHLISLSHHGKYCAVLFCEM